MEPEHVNYYLHVFPSWGNHRRRIDMRVIPAQLYSSPSYTLLKAWEQFLWIWNPVKWARNSKISIQTGLENVHCMRPADN